MPYREKYRRRRADRWVDVGDNLRRWGDVDTFEVEYDFIGLLDACDENLNAAGESKRRLGRRVNVWLKLDVVMSWHNVTRQTAINDVPRESYVINKRERWYRLLFLSRGSSLRMIDCARGGESFQ